MCMFRASAPRLRTTRRSRDGSSRYGVRATSSPRPRTEMFAAFNRPYVKVYLTIVASLFLVVAVSALVWRTGPEMEVARNAFEMAGAVATAALADPSAPVSAQQKAVDRLAKLLKTDLALYAAD